MISEKNEAESMTPAAKPSERSRPARDGIRPKSTGTAPTAVSDPAARLPRKPSAIGESGSSFASPASAAGQSPGWLERTSAVPLSRTEKHIAGLAPGSLIHAGQARRRARHGSGESPND